MVTTMVQPPHARNHTNGRKHTHHEHREREVTGRSEEYGDKSDEDQGSEQHSSHDEEGGPTRFMGKNSEGALKVLVCCGVGISRNDVNLEVIHLLKHCSEDFSNSSRRIHCSLVVEMAYTAP